MTLSNKEQNHSDTNNSKTSEFSNKQTAETNFLYLHITPKTTTSAMDNAPDSPPAAPQIRRAGMAQLIVQILHSFIGLETKQELRCDEERRKN